MSVCLSIRLSSSCGGVSLRPATTGKFACSQSADLARMSGTRGRSGFCGAEGFALVVGASGLVTTLVVQLEYEGTNEPGPVSAMQKGLL